MLRVIFLYKAVCDLAAEFGQPAVFDDDKLLIGGGVDREAVSLCRETVAQFEREAHRRCADLFIQAVGEQGVELNRVQAALCDHRAVALDHGLELARHIAVREHDRLAAQRAALGAADVEHIGQPCDVRERHVGICRQAVAEARAIEEERQIECLAHGGNALQLVFRVKRAVFGRMGDIDHAREYHVVMAFVRIERLDVLAQIVRVQLAVPVRNGQHLVSGALDGAGLMGVHMAAG